MPQKNAMHPPEARLGYSIPAGLFNAIANENNNKTEREEGVPLTPLGWSGDYDETFPRVNRWGDGVQKVGEKVGGTVLVIDSPIFSQPALSTWTE